MTGMYHGMISGYVDNVKPKTTRPFNSMIEVMSNEMGTEGK